MFGRWWNLQFASGCAKLLTTTTSACHAFAKCGGFACRYLALRKKKVSKFWLGCAFKSAWKLEFRVQVEEHQFQDEPTVVKLDILRHFPKF